MKCLSYNGLLADISLPTPYRDRVIQANDKLHAINLHTTRNTRENFTRRDEVKYELVILMTEIIVYEQNEASNLAIQSKSNDGNLKALWALIFIVLVGGCFANKFLLSETKQENQVAPITNQDIEEEETQRPTVYVEEEEPYVPVKEETEEDDESDFFEEEPDNVIAAKSGELKYGRFAVNMSGFNHLKNSRESQAILGGDIIYCVKQKKFRVVFGGYLDPNDARRMLIIKKKIVDDAYIIDYKVLEDRVNQGYYYCSCEQ